MLRPTYPGSMNLIRRNLNNVIFVLDLSQSSALLILADNVRQFVSRGIPIRFGLVPRVGEEGDASDVSAQVAQVIWYLAEKYGRASAMQFCSEVSCSGLGRE